MSHTNFEDVRVDTDAWENLYFPAQGINPPGGASDASVEAATGLLLFDPVLINVIAGIAQFPHCMVPDSIIVPNIHWQKTTSAAGGVAWKFDYELVSNGEVATMNYDTGSVTATSTIADTPDDDTANRILITTLGNVSTEGLDLAGLMFWKLTRDPDNAADTYGADARLVEIDIQFRVGSFGSGRPFSRTGTESWRR